MVASLSRAALFPHSEVTGSHAGAHFKSDAVSYFLHKCNTIAQLGWGKLAFSIPLTFMLFRHLIRCNCFLRSQTALFPHIEVTGSHAGAHFKSGAASYFFAHNIICHLLPGWGKLAFNIPLILVRHLIRCKCLLSSLAQL